MFSLQDETQFSPVAVRDEPLDRADPLRRGTARIDANDGGGKYTITETWWDPQAEQWIDAAGAPGLVEIEAIDVALCSQGRGGQMVRYWEERAIGGEVVRFIDASGIEGSQKVAAFSAHYAGSNETTGAFFTVPGCLNSLVQIGLDVRLCSDNGAAGEHPGCAATRIGGGAALAGWGNCIATWQGDEGNWIELKYCARDADGASIGAGTEAIAGFHMQCRVRANGTLEFRVVNENGEIPYYNACVIAGAVWATPCGAAPGTIEFGNGEDHEKVDIPEGDSVWGDGIWQPRG